MFKAVLLDRDGVIIDSEEAYIQSMIRAMKELGITLTENDLAHAAGTHPKTIVAGFKEKHSFDEEEFFRLQRIFYYEEFERAPLFDETVAAMKKLQEKYQVGIVTSSNLETTQKVIEKAGLQNLSVVVTNDIYTHFKPDPEPYLLAASKLGVDPRECLVVEDSNPGTRAAKAAGMTVLSFPGEHTKNQDFSMADKVISSADEIFSFLED